MWTWEQEHRCVFYSRQLWDIPHSVHLCLYSSPETTFTPEWSGEMISRLLPDLLCSSETTSGQHLNRWQPQGIWAHSQVLGVTLDWSFYLAFVNPAVQTQAVHGKKRRKKMSCIRMQIRKATLFTCTVSGSWKKGIFKDYKARLLVGAMLSRH